MHHVCNRILCFEKKFLLEAAKDPALMEKLSKDKVVFFLHLLGLDTNGHSHKPYSQWVQHNF